MRHNGIAAVCPAGPLERRLLIRVAARAFVGMCACGLSGPWVMAQDRRRWRPRRRTPAAAATAQADSRRASEAVEAAARRTQALAKRAADQAKSASQRATEANKALAARAANDGSREPHFPPRPRTPLRVPACRAVERCQEGGSPRGHRRRHQPVAGTRVHTSTRRRLRPAACCTAGRAAQRNHVGADALHGAGQRIADRRMRGIGRESPTSGTSGMPLSPLIRFRSKL
jgi:hypothetical protein